jgi:hypothetical protein
LLAELFLRCAAGVDAFAVTPRRFYRSEYLSARGFRLLLGRSLAGTEDLVVRTNPVNVIAPSRAQLRGWITDRLNFVRIIIFINTHNAASFARCPQRAKIVRVKIASVSDDDGARGDGCNFRDVLFRL